MYLFLSFLTCRTCAAAPALWLLCYFGRASRQRATELGASDWVGCVRTSGTVLSRCCSLKPGGFPAQQNSLLWFHTAVVPLCTLLSSTLAANVRLYSCPQEFRWTLVVTFIKFFRRQSFRFFLSNFRTTQTISQFARVATSHSEKHLLMRTLEH